MNGVRSIFMRKGYLFTALTAAVLLAASSGTAWAQADPTVTINSVSLSPTIVDEGGDATITVKFTVQAGTGTGVDDGNGVVDRGDEAADPEVAVGFAFSGADLTTTPRATKAVVGNFTGITETPANSQEYVGVAAIRGGNKRQYTATRTFRANHDLDAENGQFKLVASVSGWTADNSGDGVGDNVADPVPAVGAATYIIKDDETQTYTLSISSTLRGAIKEGNLGVDVTLAADPGRSTADAVPAFTLVAEPSTLSTFAAVDGETFTQGGTASGTPGVGNVGPSGLAVAAGSAGARTDLPIGTIAALDDENRVDDTVTLNLYTGGVGAASLVTSLSLVATDVNKLAAPAAITAVAKDAALNGKEVTEIVEGGDPVYLTITVDRGTGDSVTTAEDLMVNIRSNAAQSGDYEVDPVRVSLPGKDDGKSTTDVDIMLTALPNNDVGTEDLMLNLEVSGVAGTPSGSSTGMFTIAIVDKTETKVAPKSQDVAYPAIMDAIEMGAGEDGLNPGESFSVKTSDLFTLMDGYTAAYGASVEGGGVNVGASADAITIDAISATDGEAKVTVTATAKMAGSSFMPSQTIDNIAEITFPVTVVDKPLVVTVAADPAEIMEGGTSTITATANRAIQAGDGAVEIGLEVVGDATLDANSITIAMGDMSGSAMLTAAEDDNYEDETVTVVATGSGIDAARQVAIAVTDNDEAPVEPEPGNTIEPMSEEDAYPVITGAIEMGAGDEGLNPGESFSVMASALFTVMDGYTASYSASVDNGDVASTSVSGDSVTVMADMAGEAKVTISGTSRMASSSFAPEQVDTNMADITFLVTVVDKMLVVMLEMPANVMDGNIVEGESYDIVVSANRMVSEDTEVMIMRDRAGSDAGEDDYSVSMATIMAGYDSATAELMVTEDMEPDSGTNDNMGEQLVLFGMVNGEQTNALTFTIWDQAVPALPLFGQLLLALFLMLGGARLYRRRQG